MIEYFDSSLVTARATLEAFSNDSQSLLPVAHAVQLPISSLERGGQAFFCGNGARCATPYTPRRRSLGDFSLIARVWQLSLITTRFTFFASPTISVMNKFFGNYSNRTSGLATYCWRSASAGKARSSPTPRTLRATSANNRPISMRSSPGSTPWPVKLLQRVWSATSDHCRGANEIKSTHCQFAITL